MQIDHWVPPGWMRERNAAAMALPSAAFQARGQLRDQLPVVGAKEGGFMPTSSRERSAAYRARRRAERLRRVEFWVPDVRSPEFAREAHRQSVLIAQSEEAEEDQAFIDAISCWNDLA
jgi:hypothetical protein